jgi:membrane fusion protein, heavy metal efflux system
LNFMHTKLMPAWCLFLVPCIIWGCHGMKKDESRPESLNDSSRLPAEQKMHSSLPGHDSLTPGNGKGYLLCTGVYTIPSSDMVPVTHPVGGVVKTLPCHTGSFVRSGSLLAVIENIEFLKLEQQYLEAKSQYFFYGEDLKRQGGLALENATSVKKMQQAQLDYQTSEIRFRSLAKQLVLIGLNADSLDADHLSSTVYLRAPVSGYVHTISIQAGNMLASGAPCIMLVPVYHPVLAFQIPEQLLNKLKAGQQVDFFPRDDSTVIYQARLSFIDKQANPETHLVRLRATPIRQSGRLIPGMQVTIRLPGTDR